MEITRYTKATLADAIERPEFWDVANFPITRHRAVSHINNLQADPDDVVLLVIYEEGEVVGYLGVLPDNLIVEGEKYKVGWMTAWWVAPHKSGGGLKGYGAALMYDALDAYNNNIAVSSLTRAATRLFDATNMYNTLLMTELKHIHFSINTKERFFNKLKRAIQNVKELKSSRQGEESRGPKKRPVRIDAQPKGPARTRFVRPLFDVLDGCVHHYIRFNISRWKRKNKELFNSFDIEYLSEVDEEAGAFIEAHRKKELTARGPETLNWIIKYPWVIPGVKQATSEQRFFFSSLCHRFTFFVVKIFDRSSKEMIGFLMMRLRDGELTVPYSYVMPGRTQEALYVILQHVVDFNVHDLYLSDPDLMSAYEDSQFPHIRDESMTRRSHISKSLEHLNLDDYILQDGDGDQALT